MLFGQQITFVENQSNMFFGRQINFVKNQPNFFLWRLFRLPFPLFCSSYLLAKRAPLKPGRSLQPFSPFSQTVSIVTKKNSFCSGTE